MSTLRVSNIEAKADVSSPTVDEKIKFTNSSGDVLFHLDGKTSGITTVGINTTGNTFTVNNTTGDVSFSGSVTSSGVSTFSSDVSIADKIVHIGDTDTAIRFPAADTFAVETGGSEAIRVHPGGQFSVGTATTNNAFVNINPPSTHADQYVLRLRNDGDNSTKLLFANKTGGFGQIWYQEGFRLVDDADGDTERLRIDSSGNVSIGHNSPRSKLDVFETVSGNQTAIRIGNTNTPTSANDKRLEFVDGTGTSEGTNKYTYGYIQGYREGGSNSGALIFGTKPDNASAPSERLRITSSGNVGIGTNTVNFTQFGSNTAGVAIQDIGGTNTGIKLSDGNYHNYLVQAGNSNLYLSHYGSGGDIIFGTGSSGEERARLLYSGGLTFNGDTAAANALDDYEEGTWTPTIVWSGGSTGVTYSYQKGGYVKIGNVVHYYGFLMLSNFTGASGQAKLSNFPFASKNQSFYYHAPAMGWYTNLAVTAYGLGLDISPGSTSHTILRGTGTSISGLGPSDINSNFACEWSFTVHVN